MARAEKASRFSGCSVSGMRTKNQAPKAIASISMETKIACQPPSATSPLPIAGARIGTMRKTMVVSDMTRAISRPAKRSRTIVTASTRPAAAPVPWMKRATRRASKSAANVAMTQPIAKIARPARKAGRRPRISAAGP